MEKLTHFDASGAAVMVDVSEKAPTQRSAKASGKILCSRDILETIQKGTNKKGDVLGVARIAGIMGAKQTSSLIPLCHPLPLTKCTVDFEMEEDGIVAFCTVKTEGKTGVEMEALTGLSTALLCIYDMCKAVDKRMEITQIHLEEKSGGKSGDFSWES